MLGDELLRDLIEGVSGVPLGNKAVESDILGDAYEYLIGKFADITRRKKAGEFYTPRSVVRMMVELLDPQGVRLFFVGGSLRRRRGGRQLDPSTRGRGEEAAKGTGVRRYLCRQRPLGVFRWYSRASWKVSVRIKSPAARGALRTASRGRPADRPFDEPATSTARRIAAATWMMSSTSCGFQGVRGGAREAVAMVTRRISNK